MLRILYIFDKSIHGERYYAVAATQILTIAELELSCFLYLVVKAKPQYFLDHFKLVLLSMGYYLFPFVLFILYFIFVFSYLPACYLLGDFCSLFICLQFTKAFGNYFDLAIKYHFAN